MGRIRMGLNEKGTVAARIGDREKTMLEELAEAMNLTRSSTVEACIRVAYATWKMNTKKKTESEPSQQDQAGEEATEAEAGTEDEAEAEDETVKEGLEETAEAEDSEEIEGQEEELKSLLGDEESKTGQGGNESAL